MSVIADARFRNVTLAVLLVAACGKDDAQTSAGKTTEKQGSGAAPTAASPPSPTIPRTAPAQASINQLFLEEAAAEDSTLDQPAESSAPPAATKVPASTAQPSHYWTWRLLSQGFSPAEVAAIRSLSDDVVLDHALRAADSGSKIDAGWFLSSERIAAIRAVLGPNPPSRIRPLLDKLPRGTRYEDVQLVIKSPASGDSGSRA